MKMLFRLILSLSLLLLYGQGSSYANLADNSSFSSILRHKAKQCLLPQKDRYEASSTIPASYHRNSKDHPDDEKIFVTETEDENDEISFIKKLTGRSSYFSSYYPIAHDFHCTTARNSYCCKLRAVIVLSRKFIVYRAIRV